MTLVHALGSLYERCQREHGGLVFQTRNGTPYSDTNLLLRDLKTCGSKNRDPLAQLAYVPPNTRHTVAVGGGIAQRRASAARAHTTFHYP